MAVGLVRLLGVFKAHLLDYIVFCLTLTTENCFEHMTRLSTRLTGKNSTDGSPGQSIHQPFFRCNISPKSAIFSISG
jgi:hypothetical protein